MASDPPGKTSWFARPRRVLRAPPARWLQPRDQLPRRQAGREALNGAYRLLITADLGTRT